MNSSGGQVVVSCVRHDHGATDACLGEEFLLAGGRGEPSRGEVGAQHGQRVRLEGHGDELTVTLRLAGDRQQMLMARRNAVERR